MNSTYMEDPRRRKGRGVAVLSTLVYVAMVVLLPSVVGWGIDYGGVLGGMPFIVAAASVMLAYVAVCFRLFQGRPFVRFCLTQGTIGIGIPSVLWSEALGPYYVGAWHWLLMGGMAVIAPITLAAALALSQGRSCQASHAVDWAAKAKPPRERQNRYQPGTCWVVLQYLVFAGVTLLFMFMEAFQLPLPLFWALASAFLVLLPVGYPVSMLLLFRGQRFTFNSLGHIGVMVLVYSVGFAYLCAVCDDDGWGTLFAMVYFAFALILMLGTGIILLAVRPEIVKLFNACFGMRQGEICEKEVNDDD